MEPESFRFRTGSGVELVVDRYLTGADRAILVSHGIFAHRQIEEIQQLARHLAQRYDVYTFDCRGHGDSEGRFSFGLAEWLDLVELATSLRPAYRKLGGIGFSFGAFHTCIAGARGNVFDAVALVAGPRDFQVLDHNPLGPLRRGLRMMLQRRRRRTRLGFNLALGRRIMPIDCIKDLAVPVLLVHGNQDWIVHHRHSEELFKNAREPRSLAILEGGLHAEYLLQQMPEAFFQVLDPWLDEHLR